MLIIGGFIGLGLALAMLAVRARCWAAVGPLGKISLVTLVLIAGGGVITLVLSGGKGGDAGMAAMTWLIFLVLGLALVAGMMALIGALQAAAFKLPMWPTALSVIPEVVALGLVVSAYHSQVAVPAQKAITAEWWERELTYRNSRKNTHDEIPAQYRGITTEMLNMRAAQAQQLAKQGVSVPPLVPKHVEEMIRKAEVRANEPEPIPDRAKQAQIGVDEAEFRKGAVGGWLLGALLCPWILRRWVLPPWHKPTA